MKNINEEDWEHLETISVQQLDTMKGKSPLGFYYLGVSLYKMNYFDQSVKAFLKSDDLKKNNPDLHYNLGLTYFKLEHYSLAVEHLTKCTKLNPIHKFAFNNLAFIFNMHEYYSETIAICSKAELNIIEHQMNQK